MAAPTTADVLALADALYPLTSAPSAVQTAWVQQARELAGEDAFGVALTLALAHLVGHYVEVWLRSTNAGSSTGGGGGTAGVVTSSRSSSLAVSFGAWGGAGAWTPGSGADADLMQTPGGRAYMALRDAQAAITAPRVC